MSKETHTGLINLGNTCFLNSCIQILHRTKELNSLLKEKQTSLKDLPEKTIVQSWLELHELMTVTNGIISPNKFVYHVHELARKKQKELFTGWSQNDLPEFLLFLVECFHNSFSRRAILHIKGTKKNETDALAIACYDMLKDIFAKEYSEILDIFYAIYISKLSSLDGKIYNLKPEQFFILDLPIPTDSNYVTLYDCFEEYLKVELLQGENAWLNEKTNEKEDVKKQILLWSLPRILVIMLKRNSMVDKLRHYVDYPLQNLNLSKYIVGYNPNKYVYDLFGVCNHYGGIHGGHYTCNVLKEDGSWMHFNDTQFETIDAAKVVNPMAYCLFYKMKA